MCPIEISQGSLDEKVIRVLQKIYPITLKELYKEITGRNDKIKLAIQRLESAGIIQLEPLEDKTYVRLIRTDVMFLGTNPTQKKRFKHKGKKKKKTYDDDSLAYA